MSNGSFPVPSILRADAKLKGDILIQAWHNATETSEGELVNFFCHSSTLYPQCSFFEDALSGCWLESASADRSAGVLGVIVLLEEGAQGVLDLMSYFYPTLKLELSAENWLDVMASADKFHAPGLVGLCRDFARLRIQAQPLQTLHIGLEFRRSSLFFGSVAAIIDNFPAYQSEELWLCLPSDIISWIQGLHDAWQIRCMGTPTSSQLPLNSRRPHPSVIYMAWLQSDLKIGDNQPAVPRIKRIGQLVGESTIYSRPNDFWRKSNPAYLEVFAKKLHRDAQSLPGGLVDPLPRSVSGILRQEVMEIAAAERAEAARRSS